MTLISEKKYDENNPADMAIYHVIYVEHNVNEKSKVENLTFHFNFTLKSLCTVAPSANAAFQGERDKTLRFKIHYIYNENTYRNYKAKITDKHVSKEKNLKVAFHMPQFMK